MKVEVTLIIAIASLVAGIVGTYFAVRRGNRAEDLRQGESRGVIVTKIDSLHKDVAEIKADVRKMSEEYKELYSEVRVVKRDLKTAFVRIDELK